MDKINVLDKGFVKYIDHFGSDDRIIEAARVSYKGSSKGKDKDKKLLFYLYKNSHTSPFEQVSITFHIKLPLFVQGQLVRHRTARLNQISARYSKMSDDFYIPEKWRKQDMKNKQGSNFDEKWKPYCEWKHSDSSGNESVSDAIHEFCEETYDLYLSLIESGVAREMARMVLPQNIYTEIYWNMDLNNLLKFFRLRIHPHSQWEIQQYAEAIKKITSIYFPWTIEAFNKFKFKLIEEDI